MEVFGCSILMPAPLLLSALLHRMAVPAVADKHLLPVPASSTRPCQWTAAEPPPAAFARLPFPPVQLPIPFAIGITIEPKSIRNLSLN